MRSTAKEPAGGACCAGKGLPLVICCHFSEYLHFPYLFLELLTAAIATGHSVIHSFKKTPTLQTKKKNQPKKPQPKTPPNHKKPQPSQKKTVKGELVSLSSIHTTTVLPSGGPRYSKPCQAASKFSFVPGPITAQWPPRVTHGPFLKETRLQFKPLETLQPLLKTPAKPSCQITLVIWLTGVAYRWKASWQFKNC